MKNGQKQFGSMDRGSETQPQMVENLYKLI